jgi:hypothetical protein
MNHIDNYEQFLEQMSNPNTTQGYLNSLSKKPILKNSRQQQKPTDEVDVILQSAEDQKQKIVIRKDAIEKGLLNNIQTLEPENQVDVKTQVKDYTDQVKEFDKTVKQIDKLNQTLKGSNSNSNVKSQMQKSRQKNF